MSGEAFETIVSGYYEDAADLLIKKHRDYGPHNIGRAPGGAVNGLRVRMWDKLARINNLVDTGATPENEGLRDSFIDLANYAMIGLLVLDGYWPGTPEAEKRMEMVAAALKNIPAGDLK